MSPIKENKDKSEKEEKIGSENVQISEEHLLELIEHANQETVSTCLRHFEKFHKEELEFQRKVQLEDREYKRQKEKEDAKIKRDEVRNERFWRLLAILLALAAMYWLVWDGSRTRDENQKRAAKEHQIDLIREDIKEQKQILQNGGDAISNLRTVYAEILRNCQYGHPFPQEKQDALRREAWQKIVDAFALVPYDFNETVVDKARELVKFDTSIKDLCRYKGNLDDRILQYKREVFDLANQSLEENKKKIEELK